MVKKKGLSLEEKQERILQIFHESGDVFVLKSLVDDGKVHQEKIGSSNYFWAFPGEAVSKLKYELSAAQQDLANQQQLEQQLQLQLAEAKKGKEDSNVRAELLKHVSDLEEELATVQKEVVQFERNDPEAVKALEEGAKVARDAANRWLDNTFQIQSWCKKQFQGREKELDKFFKQEGLTDEIDYIT